jgi:hypothetical protein
MYFLLTNALGILILLDLAPVTILGFRGLKCAPMNYQSEWNRWFYCLFSLGGCFYR